MVRIESVPYTHDLFSTEAFDTLPAITCTDHDEIRGMARDSRSLGTGLSNAELLARDMNRMQAMVTANDPDANALL